MSYIGLLHQELYHNHPVLRVFCQILIEASKVKVTEVIIEEQPIEDNYALYDKQLNNECQYGAMGTSNNILDVHCPDCSSNSE